MLASKKITVCFRPIMRLRLGATYNKFHTTSSMTLFG